MTPKVSNVFFAGTHSDLLFHKMMVEVVDCLEVGTFPETISSESEKRAGVCVGTRMLLCTLVISPLPS